MSDNPTYQHILAAQICLILEATRAIADEAAREAFLVKARASIVCGLAGLIAPGDPLTSAALSAYDARDWPNFFARLQNLDTMSIKKESV